MPHKKTEVKLMVDLKYALCACVLGAALILGACSGGNEAGESTTLDVTVSNGEVTNQASRNPGFEEIDFYFAYNGSTLAPLDDATEIVSVFGDPVVFYSATSCYAEGDDKQYDYNGFSVYTYPDGGKDIVSIIELNDDTVSTPKGAKIGMTLSEVESLYGTDHTSEGLTEVYYLDNGCSLAFTLENGIVTLIEYLYNS